MPELPPGETSEALVEAPEAEAKRGEEERRHISLPERVRLVCMDLGPSFVKLGQIAQPLRAALTGSTVSPGIFEVLAILGRDESLTRLRAAA